MSFGMDDTNALFESEEFKTAIELSRKDLKHHEDIYRARYLGRPYPLTKVEFDETEQAMIREISHKTGYSREDVVRQAVRDLHFRVCVYGGL